MHNFPEGPPSESNCPGLLDDRRKIQFHDWQLMYDIPRAGRTISHCAETDVVRSHSPLHLLP
jgi:hypothetical protein